MKPVNVSELKKELKLHSQQDLIEICLKLAKFKKENKELLTYLLYESDNEHKYIKEIKEEVDFGFSTINFSSNYFIKKSTRKILRMIKKYIRYSKKKETEAELLIYFCKKIKQLKPTYTQSKQITNMFEQQLKMARKAISGLHEDLQYDFNLLLEEIEI